MKAAPSCELFLDLKLHDIPNTVAGAVRSVSDLRPKYLTVHATGGPQMIAAAVQAAPEMSIAAVTVLTSMSESDLSAVGMVGSGIRTLCAGWRRWPSTLARGHWCVLRKRLVWFVTRWVPTSCSSLRVSDRSLPNSATRPAWQRRGRR